MKYNKMSKRLREITKIGLFLCYFYEFEDLKCDLFLYIAALYSRICGCV